MLIDILEPHLHSRPTFISKHPHSLFYPLFHPRRSPTIPKPQNSSSSSIVPNRFSRAPAPVGNVARVHRQPPLLIYRYVIHSRVRVYLAAGVRVWGIHVRDIILRVGFEALLGFVCGFFLRNERVRVFRFSPLAIRLVYNGCGCCSCIVRWWNSAVVHDSVWIMKRLCGFVSWMRSEKFWFGCVYFCFVCYLWCLMVGSDSK